MCITSPSVMEMHIPNRYVYKEYNETGAYREQVPYAELTVFENASNMKMRCLCFFVFFTNLSEMFAERAQGI